MSSFFGRSEPTEYTYHEDGEVEADEAINENVEVPEQVAPDVKEEPTKVDKRGKYSGGSDYVFYGDF